MKRTFALVSVFTIITGALFFGCEKDAPQSIYDPNYQSTIVAPVVSSIVPESHPYILGGVTTILFNGSGFGTDTSKLHVYFNSSEVRISSITATQVKILAPNMIQDSIKIRLRLDGSDKFSDLGYVSIRSVLLNVKEIDTTKQIPAAITFDKTGNLYASVYSKGGISDGIYKVTPGGTSTQFAIRGTEPFFTGLKMRGDSIIAARAVNRVVSKNSTTNVMNSFTAPLPTTVDDFDYDQKKILWTGGATSDDGILSIDSLKNVAQFPFNGIIRSVRVFGTALYVSNESSIDSTNAVYKIPINSDNTLGTAEKYFDLSITVGNKTNKVFGITFDSQGNLYVGTDAPAGIYVVATNKSVQSLYNGVIGPNCKYLAWGNGPYLYVVREKSGTSTIPTGVFKIDMLGKVTAPYYGQ